MRAKILGLDKKLDVVKIEVTDDEGLKYFVMIPRPADGRFPSNDDLVKAAVAIVRGRQSGPKFINARRKSLYGPTIEQRVAKELLKFGYGKKEAQRLAANEQGSNVKEIVKRIVARDTHISVGGKRNAGAVPIYGRVLRIEAEKTWEHEYGGKKSKPSQKYFHDFTTKNAMIYGLPDGSLLIKVKGK